MTTPFWIQEHTPHGWFCRTGVERVDWHHTLEEAVEHLRELALAAETSVLTVVLRNGRFDTVRLDLDADLDG